MLTCELLNKYDGDTILYYGGISRSGYHQMSDILEDIENKKEKVCLILITYGGDPDAAYRIARATNHHYETVEILIPDVCKSAGTLLCIGASKLIFGDRGELGPLDIQISKPDEMFESMSGLNIIQALNAINIQLLDSFREYWIDIKGGSRVSTKLAADIAAKLASGYITPIASKIDPLTLGEHQRAMQIAYDYGERLNTVYNSLIEDESLVRLVSGYPSHGFVIDRKEASSLFKCVERPDESTAGLYDWSLSLRGTAVYDDQNPIVSNLADIAAALEKKQGKNIKGDSDEIKEPDEQEVAGGGKEDDKSSELEGQKDESLDEESSEE